MKILPFFAAALCTQVLASGAYTECAKLERSEPGALSQCMTQRMRMASISDVQKTRAVLPWRWRSATEPPLLIERDFSGVTSLGAACLGAEAALCWPVEMGESLAVKDPQGNRVILEGEVERTFRLSCMIMDQGFAEELALMPSYELAGQSSDFRALPQARQLVLDQCR